MSSVIRPATIDDLHEICRIGRESFSHAFAYLFPAGVLERYLEATYSESKILSGLAKEENVFLVGAWNGRVCGFLKLKQWSLHPAIDSGKQWQVQKLYVDPTVFHSGVGRSLMSSGEDLMTRQQVERAWLVVHVDNSRAIEFYRVLGYQDTTSEHHTIEDIRMEYRVMSKSLCQPF